MAQPSYAPAYDPLSVIDSRYMTTHELNVIVVTNTNGDHLISDAYHNTVMFKVKPCHTMHHNQLDLLDPNGTVIVKLRGKIRSVHNRWNAFMGNSKDDSHKIFSIKKPNVIQSTTNLHVFLANKQSSKDVCDFKITGSWSNRNCSILLGDSSRTIAQMQPMQSENESFYKDKFKVTIDPNVDCAFVIAVIAIIEAMESSHKDGHHAGQVNDDVGPKVHVVAAAAQIVSAVAAVGAVAVTIITNLS